jgi:hypothetical protein
MMHALSRINAIHVSENRLVLCIIRLNYAYFCTCTANCELRVSRKSNLRDHPRYDLPFEASIILNSISPAHLLQLKRQDANWYQYSSLWPLVFFTQLLSQKRVYSVQRIPVVLCHWWTNVWLKQASAWIRFHSSLSDPVLCTYFTSLRIRNLVDFLPSSRKTVEATDRQIKLPVFLSTM